MAAARQKIAVTGATGFVGTALCAELTTRGIDFIALGRDQLADTATLANALASCSSVIHLAGLAHRTGKQVARDEDYFTVNTDLTIALAEAAKLAGVERFVFVSTVYVVGEDGADTPLNPDMPYQTSTPYARSKVKAEQALLAMSGIQTVILRPPLVYAPDAKGNLFALMQIAKSGLPLPFASIDNKRDMIGRANLVDALIFLTTAKSAPGGIFHICDGEPLSLARLITLMRKYLGLKPGLFAVPERFLQMVLRRIAGPRRVTQLLGDFRVDDTGLRALGWQPPHQVGHDYLQGPETRPKP